jgi:two-component system chemotaxis response regulator CheB
MEALRAGALTVLEKPAGTTHADYEALAERLCTQLVIMSQVKLVRQHGRRESIQRPGHRMPIPLPGAADRPVQDAGNCLLHRRAGRLVQLLGALGPAFPLPILLVQHMTASFI